MKNIKNTKNIVLCSDGTGQSGGGKNNTNVWRIYDAVDVQNNETKQLTFYDDGVGTNKNIVMKAMGLAFGFGLSKNIRELYKYTVMHYKAGDQLYLFGFSRGSHTIRLLAELICSFGILNPKSFDNEKELDKAIKALQRQFKAAIRRAWLKKVFTSWSTNTQQQLRSSTDKSLTSQTEAYDKNLNKLIKKQSIQKSHKDKQEDIHKNIPIKFIGVWDTVSAVGMPIDEMRNSLFFAHHAFVDHKLNPNVEHACHALAIDEKRHTFKPELWDQSDEQDKKRIEQVWFSGVHANVGGGYPKDQLSKVSLEWMINEASHRGLIFRESRKQEISLHNNYNGTLYDSRSGFSAFYRYKPRDIKQLTQKFYPNKEEGANIHVSVYQRIKDSSANYSPVNVPQNTNVTATKFENITDHQNKTEQKQKYCLDQLQALKDSSKNQAISTQFNNNPWNVIWWQKFLHFCFMVFFVFFITIGYRLTQDNPIIAVTSEQTSIKAIQKLAIAINEANPFYVTNKLLPGFANNWKIFILLLFVFVVLMIFRKTLKTHHNNMANMIWNRSPFDKNRVNAKRLPTNFLLKGAFYVAHFFRKRKYLNNHIIPSIKIKILPILMTAFFAWVLVELILYFFLP